MLTIETKVDIETTRVTKDESIITTSVKKRTKATK
jgi:hypothetical protein